LLSSDAAKRRTPPSLRVTEPPPDTAAMLGALSRHRSSFVAVGGQAAIWHGAARPTKDLDVCPAWDHENLASVSAALRELGAQLLGPDGRPLGVGAPAARLISQMEIGTWQTDAGRLDVLLGIPIDEHRNLARYEQLKDHAMTVEVEGIIVQIAALDDIIRSKEIANRPADREALPELYDLRDRTAR
jgi:hypothetical protein